jgi:hypothetical protein
LWGEKGKAMAISEFEFKKWESLISKFVENLRPAPHLRNQLDFGFRFDGKSVELFEIRPLWNKPDTKIEEPIAKATYVKTQELWKVYWQRADLKWHRYDPDPTVDTLEAFLEIVKKDEYACFFG